MRYIVETRKCHADADIYADANSIRTKNNVPLPFGGAHKYYENLAYYCVE